MNATNPDQILIINETSGAIVGICQVTGANNRVAVDLALDGAGNLYALALQSFGGAVSVIGNVQKFNIAAAIAAFPTPTGSGVQSADSTYTAVAVDANNNVWTSHFVQSPPVLNIVNVANGTPGSISLDPLGTPNPYIDGSVMSIDLTGTGATINGGALFTGVANIVDPFTLNFPGTTIAGAYTTGGLVQAHNGPELLVLDPTTLAISQRQPFTLSVNGPSQPSAVEGPASIVLGIGSLIWVACTSGIFDGVAVGGGQVLKINVNAFPGAASISGCVISGNGPYRLSSDGSNAAMAVGCAPLSNQLLCRIDFGGTQDSSFLGQGAVNPAMVVVDGGAPNPHGIWETAETGEIALYSSNIGTEAFTSAITTFT